MSDEKRDSLLEKFPRIKNGLRELLSLLENSTGEIEFADTAEEMTIEAIQSWAENLSISKSLESERRHKKAQKDKKNNLV